MKLKVAINGFGRIGRNVLRAFYESDQYQNIQIVAINDLTDIESATHLLKYDSIHGRFKKSVNCNDSSLTVEQDSITYFSQANPKKLPWRELEIDCVFECTGRFTNKDAALAHIEAGAKKVIVSAPTKNADATIVYGVNHQTLTPDMQVISSASCTTNCLAPIAKVLNDSVGIEFGNMTTIHAITNDQNMLDFAHKDIYRARSAIKSMIPTKTGAASAVGLVLPELEGRLNGMAVRVPTLNVSVVDLHFLASRETHIDEINATVKEASGGAMGNILQYNDEPLVSIDFNHQAASSIFDANQTQVNNGKLVKVMAWYDNEWGFSNRMLDNALLLHKMIN
ncbi:type I glyceraldehyde-3-phosphate dehydrogenase [Aliikangiella sp. IMCC44359]|uniref:type I glyceraldehyde-3-phosphate dehydrogenase n=1 Tax=Aliikangiella sp. IMCC44359 TaxID=3459125 RepID=UPI00403AB6F3